MDHNLYHFFIDGFCNRYYYILNNIDYCDKNIVDPLYICYIIPDLNNPVFSLSLLLIGPINYYM